MSSIKRNNSKVLGGTLLFLLLQVISVNSVKANPTHEIPDEPIYLSQARGHEAYKGEPQMSWDDYEIGKIVAKYEGTVSVLTEDGTVIRVRPASSVGSTGDNVLIVEEDGKKVVVGSTHPAWLGTLIEEYNFSIENDR
ncbi:MAG: hypothetical protein WBM44_08490 [Waterburya sp.]